MKKVLLNFPILIFFLAMMAAAGVEAASLSASVDRNQVALEDQITYTLTAEGFRDAGPPILPDLNDFQVQPAGTSSQINIVNGAISQSVQFNYILIPKKAGDFVIPPATLSHKGEILKSQPIKVRVQQSGSGAAGVQGEPENAEDSTLFIFARALISQKDPYENQQIVYTFRLYRRVDIAEANLNLPEFKGFWAEDLGKQREFTQNLNGVNFNVTEIRKALFPLKPGKLTIESALLQCDVLVQDQGQRGGDPFGRLLNDPFFNGFMGRQKRVRKNLRSEAMEVNVQPLPTAGMPANFNKLVGSFTLRATMEKEELEVGGSNTLTVIVEGDGNSRDADLQLEVNGGQFKIYDGQPVVEVETGGDWLVGRKTFKKALVPVKEGALSLPQIELAYFDPQAREYRTLRASLQPMRVSSAGEKETLELAGDLQNAPEKAKIKIIGQDIFPIHTDAEALKESLTHEKFLAIIIMAMVLPTALFLGSFFVVRTRERRFSSAALYRYKGALSQARKKLKAAAPLAISHKGQEFFSESSRILKDYIGDKLNISGGSLTPAEAGELLQKRGVEEKTRAETIPLLERCEAGRFAPLGAAENNMVGILEDIHSIINKLEKGLHFR